MTMAAKRPQLAKLTRPRLHNAVARERLFTVLDEAREHKPAICVVGPPGAGKTTLVASWLDARKIKGIWYQVDSGDADLATLFYYLGEASKPFSRKGQRPLPLLTPEYLGDVEGFSRRFFRELLSRLPDDAALVLDNYQELGPERQFHQLIAHAVGEVPAGMTLVAISRRDPPDCYARLVANASVQLVEWDELKLTLEETRAIAGTRSTLADQEVLRLHDLSGGWVAGLTLLLEHERENAIGPVPNRTEGVEAIFQYFASLIFDQATPEIQRFLVLTAHLPQVVVSVARDLTGNDHALDILENLYRRHLFTHRRTAGKPTYWYHALFRSFLLTRGKQILTAEQQRDVYLRAAGLLDAEGASEQAFELLREAGDWQQAQQIVFRQAPRLLEQGRGQTLREWILALPANRREDEPWLTYWLGVSLIQINQNEARRYLESAFSRFSATRDITGQMYAVSSIIYTHFFEWAQWRAMDAWIDMLEILIRQENAYPSIEVEFDINCSMLIATLYRRPGHPRLPACVDRVEAMLESDLDVNRKVTGATLLLTFCNLANKPGRAQRTIARVERLIERPEITPLNQVWWYCRLTWYLNAHGHFAAVEKYIHAANQLIETYGLKGLRSATMIINAHWAWGMMGLKDWNRANELVCVLESQAQSSRLSDLVLAAESRTRLLICQGQLVQALRFSIKAIEAAVATGMVWWEVLQRSSAVEALAELGRHGEARDHLYRCYALVRGTCISYWETELRIIEASMARQEGDIETCHVLLQRAFTGPDGQWRDGRLYGRVLSSMCAEALDAHIEIAKVRAVIQRLRLDPPSSECAMWPWPVRIHALGGFQVAVNDKMLTFAGKAPKKPLTLLKVLISFGGRNVPEERLMDALWPDEEADAARKSLDITVLRLRKLLGSHETIIVSDELIGLNPQLCWWTYGLLSGGSPRPKRLKGRPDYPLLLRPWLSISEIFFLPIQRSRGR